ncbi:CP24A-like protein [Mya arenaria]|uniref:Cholesterol side-chain cleavage enzyme, mitochondrial n=1 Tax=Mya arenaria TaxID=6604 RepID=A0ABY7EU97_MYAAR|nr:CP24A-like protein [Mya arenaria]
MMQNSFLSPIFKTGMSSKRRKLENGCIRRILQIKRRFHAKYGPMFRERLGPVTNLSIADPRLVEELFRQEGKYPNRPPYDAWLLYKDMRKRTHGISATSGEEWRKIRTILNNGLARPRQASTYVQDLSTVAGRMVNRLSYLRDRNTTDNSIPNVHRVMNSWSIESIGKVLVGESFGALEHDLSPEMEGFMKSIEDMWYTGHQLMVFANVHKRLNTKIWKTHVQSWDTILEVADNIFEKKRNEIERRLATGGELGTATSANVMSMAMHLLSQNPEVQKRVRAEVDNVCGEGEEMTLDHLNNMPYLKAVKKEVLRLFPTIPTNARVLTEDTFIGGHLIPKNTIVLLNTFTMCRDPEEFNNPDEFIPERWLRNEVRDFSPFTSLPFGFGARSCPGRRVAETMIYFGIANIVRRFELRPTKNSTQVKPFVRTVLTLGNELPIEFHDR